MLALKVSKHAHLESEWHGIDSRVGHQLFVLLYGKDGQRTLGCKIA